MSVTTNGNVPRPESLLRFSRCRRLPVTLQNESSECALACLAMIASYHGRRTNLGDLRRQFRISLTGSSVASMARIAASMNLAARSVRLEPEELRQLARPAILHWRLNHFVVLAAVRKRGAIIHDPARGRRFIAWPDVSRFFTGVAIELTPTRHFEHKDDLNKVRLRDLWTSSSGLGTSLLQILFLSAVLQVFSLLSPLINQLVVDDAIARNDGEFLVAILIGFALLLVSQAIVQVLRSSALMYMSQSLAFQLRSNLLRHLLRLPADFFERRHIGDVMSRLESMQPVQNLLSTAVITVVLDGMLAIAMLVVMFLYSPTLAGLVVAVSAIALIARQASFPFVRRLTEERLHLDAKLQSVLLESVRAIRTIKLFNNEMDRHLLWQNSYADTTNVGIRLQRFGIAATASSTLLFGALDLAVFYVGAHAIMSGAMTLGMLFTFQAYRTQFTARVGALINQYFLFRTVGVHLERLADIVHTRPEPALELDAHNSVHLSGRVEIRNGRFRFGDNLPWLFDGIDLAVEKGERLAIVGQSGCGKSTLLKLLVGLHSLSDGVIAFDGIAISSLGVNRVRQQVAAVMQDDRLLSGSIADNICFFDDTPSHQRIAEAATLAHILDDIKRMPMGFQTLIGDMGSTLSGGQRQRLLLARALYRKPRLLLLDEGTANLDTATEKAVLESLASLEMTQIIVAHRGAAIAACDRVLQLSEGGLQQIRG